ncbi:MAG TPA: glutathione peroxidase [Gemmataceae bacterium]|nr:glutathione peroxidase [Gemmataceae bacterium]
MSRILSLFAAVVIVAAGGPIACAEEAKNVSGPLDFKVKDIKGKELDLSQYKGKVVLMVNVASRCGYTPQYEGLQALYKKYQDKGLVVIGVPANEFGKQEPGTNEEIAEFCESNYKVTFPMLSKVVVKGQGINPVFEFLTSKEKNPKFGGEIKWNFTKFLIGRDGKVAGRYEPAVKPESDELDKAITKELEKSAK